MKAGDRLRVYRHRKHGRSDNLVHQIRETEDRHSGMFYALLCDPPERHFREANDEKIIRHKLTCDKCVAALETAPTAAAGGPP